MFVAQNIDNIYIYMYIYVCVHICRKKEVVDKWYHNVGFLLVLSRRKWCTWESIVGVYSLEMLVQW
jgi:hypothetical protein